MYAVSIQFSIERKFFFFFECKNFQPEKEYMITLKNNKKYTTKQKILKIFLEIV